MKKLIIFGLSAGLILSSCERRDDGGGTTGGSTSYPTDNLTVEVKKRALVQETTGLWCQYCPNGAEQLTIAKGAYGSDVVPFSTHSGDILETPAASTFITNFPTLAVPNFYVDNVLVANYNELRAKVGDALSVNPVLGVAHAVSENDTAFLIYPKVQFFETINGESFYVECYMTLDGIEARDYGSGLDLNQVSSVATVSTGSGSTPTRWTQNAADLDGTFLISAGDTYIHEDVLWKAGANTPDWGIDLSTVNPFGSVYTKDDIFGTQYTPMTISILKDDLDYPTEISFSTVVWKLVTGDTPYYEFVNGYHQRYSSN